MIKWIPVISKEGMMFFYNKSTGDCQYTYPKIFDSKEQKYKNIFFQNWKKIPHNNSFVYKNINSHIVQNVKPSSTTYIFEAAMLDNFAFVELYVEYNGNINITDANGRNCLHYAVMNDNDYMLKILIKLGVNKEKADDAGNTPLIYSLLYRAYKCMKALIDSGVEVNKANKKGETCLFFAVKNKNIKPVLFLIKNGVKIGISNKKGEYAIDYAVKANDFAMVKVLTRLSQLIIEEEKLEEEEEEEEEDLFKDERERRKGRINKVFYDAFFEDNGRFDKKKKKKPKTNRDGLSISKKFLGQNFYEDINNKISLEDIDMLKNNGINKRNKLKIRNKLNLRYKEDETEEDEEEEENEDIGNPVNNPLNYSARFEGLTDERSMNTIQKRTNPPMKKMLKTKRQKSSRTSSSYNSNRSTHASTINFSEISSSIKTSFNVLTIFFVSSVLPVLSQIFSSTKNFFQSLMVTAQEKGKRLVRISKRLYHNAQIYFYSPPDIENQVEYINYLSTSLDRNPSNLRTSYLTVNDLKEIENRNSLKISNDKPYGIIESLHLLPQPQPQNNNSNKDKPLVNGYKKRSKYIRQKHKKVKVSIYSIPFYLLHGANSGQFSYKKYKNLKKEYQKDKEFIKTIKSRYESEIRKAYEEIECSITENELLVPLVKENEEFSPKSSGSVYQNILKSLSNINRVIDTVTSNQESNWDDLNITHIKKRTSSKSILNSDSCSEKEHEIEIEEIIKDYNLKLKEIQVKEYESSSLKGNKNDK